jgi:carboxyl-terminal processing protease
MLRNTVIILTFFCACGQSSTGQLRTSVDQDAATLIACFEKNHVSPRTFNTDFSNRLMDEILNTIDPYGIIFMREDRIMLEELAAGVHSKVDFHLMKEWERIHDILTYRIHESNRILDKLTQEFDAGIKNDSLFLHNNVSSETAFNETMREEIWRKWIWFEYTSGSEFYDDSIIRNINPKQKEDLYLGIIQKQKAKIASLKDQLDADPSELLLHCLASVYDPHSDFFSAQTKNRFLNELASERPGFGLSLTESVTGAIIVSGIVPGSPAWFSNQLQEGDEIKKIKINYRESVDVTGGSLEKIGSLLENEKTTFVQLFITKRDARLITVELKKALVQNEDNLIHSFILESGSNRIGYISLPLFYTSFSEKNPLGCANDVAKEVLKLKLEKIQGLILDLRNNGGGSVMEAAGLAGLFITEGPLAIIQNNDRQCELLRDLNRGTSYDGPLLILLNEYSASASELVAASLQDYNRAVIVGCPTYGKATIQGIFPLDSSIIFRKYNGKNEIRATKFVKITGGEIFRLDDSSYQGRGVQPDILLRRDGSQNARKESSYPNSLVPGTCTKKVAWTPYPPLPLEHLRNYFSFVALENTPSKAGQSHVEYRKEGIMLRITTENSNSNSGVRNEATGFPVSIRNPKYNQSIFQMNSDRARMNNALIETIIKDPEIFQSFLLVTEMVK